MATKRERLVIQKISDEKFQAHDTRKKLYVDLEKRFNRTIVSFFTSFSYPVMIEDTDADMLEAILQKTDLNRGLLLFISSPGGDGLAAERIINICRSYSSTGDYWAIVPGKAKSAATMICFGASKIIMGATSELGPVDPQMTIVKSDVARRYSVYNIIKSYQSLFSRAIAEKGNLQPYLQQLANYDEREIAELRAAQKLSEDIAIRSLSDGMLKGKSKEDIKTSIALFLSPEETKVHGRPIYRNEAEKAGLIIEKADIKSDTWELVYELYTRLNGFVSSHACKCIESKDSSFYANARGIN